jgi:hypothetical protein
VERDPPLDPRTEYARSKVSAERGLAELADERFAPVFLRNGTLYGLSPRMRFDIVLNDLSALAFINKKIAMVSDGSPWRPIVHIEDICEAIDVIVGRPRRFERPDHPERHDHHSHARRDDKRDRDRLGSKAPTPPRRTIGAAPSRSAAASLIRRRWERMVR